MYPPFRVCGFQSIRTGRLCAGQHERHPVLSASGIGRYVVAGLLLACAPFVHGRSFGQLVRSWPVNTGHTDYVHSVAFSPDGSMLASGARDGFISLWGVSNITTHAFDAEEEIPTAFRLHGNYPNPFNPSTRVVFDLPSAAEVTVHVFDVLGRNVVVTSPVSLSGGRDHSLEVNASSLPSGVYLYQIRAQMSSDMLVRSGRMILAK